MTHIGSGIVAVAGVAGREGAARAAIGVVGIAADTAGPEVSPRGRSSGRKLGEVVRLPGRGRCRGTGKPLLVVNGVGVPDLPVPSRLVW